MDASHINEKELAPLVSVGYESPTLDYKGPASWTAWTNRDKVELVRDITGMANGDVPGYLIVGVSQQPSGQFALEGLTPDQTAGFDPSPIRDKLKEYIDPEPQFTLHKVCVENKLFVVIRVSPFQTVPHICRKSFDTILEQGAVYVRSEGAQTIKVPSSEYMRRLIDRATQNMADSLIARIRNAVSWVPAEENLAPTGLTEQLVDARKGPRGSHSIPWEQYAAYREVTAFPGRFDVTRFSHDRLTEAARKADILFRGWPFIYFDPNMSDTYVVGDAIETVVSLGHLRGHDAFEMWQLRQSGLFVHRTLMSETVHTEATRFGKVLDFVETVFHISEAVGTLWRLYANLGVGDDEKITVEFKYTDCEGRRLAVLDPSRAGIRGNAICRTVNASATLALPLGEWRASDAKVAAKLCADIFRQFNWVQPNIPEIEKTAAEFIARPRY